MSHTKDLLAAERYAAALFQIAGSEHQDVEMAAELVSFAEALKKSPEIEKFFHNPHFGVEEKKGSLASIYKGTQGAQNVLLRFLTLLLRKNRFHLIHDITDCFKRIADEAQGEMVAEIKTAALLAPHAEQEIVSRLERIAGMKITVRKEIDPSLVGGVMIKLRNKILDGSVRNKINLFKKELTKIRSI